MKKILFIFAILSTMFCCQSCFTSDAAVYEPYDDTYVICDNTDVNIIITYGTPYYYEGRLWYYFYNGLYYYPFYYNNYWYFRPYTRLYPWGYDFHFRPTYRDYRFRPHHSDWNRPHSSGHYSGNGRRPNLGGTHSHNSGSPGHINHDRPGNRPNGGTNNGHTPRNTRPNIESQRQQNHNFNVSPSHRYIAPPSINNGRSMQHGGSVGRTPMGGRSPMSSPGMSRGGSDRRR